MQKEQYSWHSPILGMQMPIACYGHYGSPLLLFPTTAADYEEYERFGLIGAIDAHIEAGKIKVYSIDSINRHSWMNNDIHAGERARRQALYDAYVYQEVAPFIWNHCKTPTVPIGAAGAAFGAYHAVNSLLKHPDRYTWCIGMSGAYDMKVFSSGYYDDNIYFNNPVDFIPNLNDPYILAMLRQCNINILTGQGAYENPDYSRRLSEVLSQKSIPHNLDVWGPEWPHDWQTWRVQMDQYIRRLFY